MKAMRTPKMDVVRFTESDVIVASGGALSTVTISGLGNGNLGDNYLSYGSTELDLTDASNHHLSFGNGFNNNGTIKTLDILNSEAGSTDTANSDWNHTYNWDADSSLFVYRNQ